MHDENGDIDTSKASQTPMPRAYAASKRGRPETDMDVLLSKKTKVDFHDNASLRSESESHVQERVAPILSPESEADLSAKLVHAHMSSTSFAKANEFSQHSAIQPHDETVIPADVLQYTKAVAACEDVQRQHIWDGKITENSHNLKLPDSTVSADAENLPKSPRSSHSKNALCTVENGNQHCPTTTIYSAIMQNSDIAHSITPEIQDAIRNSIELVDNRSRTPSLLVQTNSTESVCATGSMPASPPTTLEDFSSGCESANKLPIELPKSRSEVAESANENLMEPFPASERQLCSVVEQHQKQASCLISPSTKSQAVINSHKNCVRRSKSTTPSAAYTKATSKRLQGGSTFGNVEESDSLRLARELQEGEFSLRRRSK